MNSAFLEWFSGKSLANANAALVLLEGSVAHGSWLPGASRKVKAALNKQNVAKKWAQANQSCLVSIGNRDNTRDSRGWAAHHAMYYGYLGNRVDTHVMRALAEKPEQHALVDVVERWSLSFAEARVAIERLDATRPVPVFTTMKASSTVSATLKSLGMAVESNTVRACPMKSEMIEYLSSKTGKTVCMMVVTVDPPEGTIRHASRFHCGKGQCEACGHAIHRPFNWVPLLIDNQAGVPHLLFVGMDCARTIFGVDVKGDLIIVRGDRQIFLQKLAAADLP